jgi:hypothetical protein
VEGRERFMVQGFAMGIDFFSQHRRQLLQSSSPLARFEFAVGRVVLRPSAAYAVATKWIHRRTEGPAWLADLERLLHRLPTKHPVQSKAREALIREEARAIAQGDFPRFELAMSERRLKVRGALAVRFRLSAFERARQRVAALDRGVAEKVRRQWEAHLSTNVRALEPPRGSRASSAR